MSYIEGHASSITILTIHTIGNSTERHDVYVKTIRHLLVYITLINIDESIEILGLVFIIYEKSNPGENS